MSLAEIQCTYELGCCVPGVLVDLGDGDCKPLPAVICPFHITDARQYGFSVTPRTGVAKLTPVARAAWKSLALRSDIPRSRYVEFTSMPSNWDKHSCKVFAAYYGKALSFKVMHSGTYGCPAGK